MQNETLVPLIQAFVNSHDFVTVEIKHPETGNVIRGSELVPRGLQMLGHKDWLNDEFLFNILKPRAGTNVRVTANGTEIRDLYFTGLQGPVNPKTGQRYRWLKVGQIFSKLRQDPDTEEMVPVVWVQIGIKPYAARSVPEEPQEPRSDEAQAAEATDTVEGI